MATLYIATYIYVASYSYIYSYSYSFIRSSSAPTQEMYIFNSLKGNEPFESTITCESATSVIRKGNLALEKESHDYQALKKRRRDAIRLTMAKMERAQQV